MNQAIELHERELYELRGKKTALEIAHEELKNSMGKNGNMEKRLLGEIEKIKSAYEIDTQKYTLKVRGYKENVRERDEQIKILTDKLKTASREAARCSNMEEHIQMLEM